MTKEQQFLLDCLADHLHKRETAKEDICVDKFFSMAEAHQCEGIVYYQLHMREFQDSFATQSFYAVKRRNLLRKIHDEFAEEKIPYLIFKGQEIAKFYPVAELRTMGDSDILVHPEDKARASDALKKIGFECKGRGKHEWLFDKGNNELELHHALIYTKTVTVPIQKSFCDNVWNHTTTTDGVQYHLELEYHLAYLIIHLRKHLMNSGVGLRQFMDLAVVSGQELAWSKVQDYLEEVQLLPFAQICFALCERWFGVKTGLAGSITEEFYEEATQRIFSNGVFGFDNEENRINGVINQAKKEGRFLTVIHTLFLGYEDMCGIARFAFLERKPYLLPIAWLYRAFLKIKSYNVKYCLKYVLSPYTKKKAEREAYLKRWEL